MRLDGSTGWGWYVMGKKRPPLHNCQRASPATPPAFQETGKPPVCFSAPDVYFGVAACRCTQKRGGMPHGSGFAGAKWACTRGRRHGRSAPGQRLAPASPWSVLADVEVKGPRARALALQNSGPVSCTTSASPIQPGARNDLPGFRAFDLPIALGILAASGRSTARSWTGHELPL